MLRYTRFDLGLVSVVVWQKWQLGFQELCFFPYILQVLLNTGHQLDNRSKILNNKLFCYTLLIIFSSWQVCGALLHQ